MAVAYSSKGAADENGASGSPGSITTNPTFPSSSANDLLVIAAIVRGTSGTYTFTTPTGFTLIGTTAPTAVEAVACWYKVSAADTGTIAVTVSSGATTINMESQIYCFTGNATSGTIVENYSENHSTTSNATVVPPSIGATSVANTLAVAIIGVLSSETNTPGAITGNSGGTWTSRATDAGTGFSKVINLQTAPLSSAGSTIGATPGSATLTPAGSFWSVMGFDILPVSATDFPRILSAGARTFAGSSLTVTVQKNITLSAGARSFAGSSLTEAVGKNVTLSAGARAFAGSNLTKIVAKSFVLSAGARAFTGSSLTETVTKVISLSPGARAFAGSNLTDAVGKNITLSAGARAFTGSSLTKIVAKSFTLSAGARPVAGSNLTETVGKNLTLSAGARAFTGSSLTDTVTKVVALSAGARAFAGSSLTKVVAKSFTLSPGARAFAGSNLTYTTGASTNYPSLLSAGARAFAGSPLTVTVAKNFTLSPGARAFTGSSLTDTVGKVIGLSAKNVPFAGSNLTEQAPLNIALTPGARSFAGLPLTYTVVSLQSGGKGGYRVDPYFYKPRKKKSVAERIEAAKEAFERLDDLETQETTTIEKARRQAELALAKIALQKTTELKFAQMLGETERAVEIFQSRLKQQAAERQRLAQEDEREAERIRLHLKQMQDDEDEENEEIAFILALTQAD